MLAYKQIGTKLIDPEVLLTMKHSLLKYSQLTFLPVLLGLSLSAHASTIFTENFDSATVNLGVTQAGQFNTINGTNVDVVGGSNFGYLCTGPESGNCVDLGGTGGNAFGDLVTTLTLAPGTYDLSFDLIGSQRGPTTSTTVSFGDYSETFVLASGDITSGIVINQIVDVTGGSTQLQFLNNGYPGDDGNEGALLDNVSITSTSPVPEPGTLGLMTTGFLGLAGAVRRRFKA
jgi:PEP-CTERM motif